MDRGLPSPQQLWNRPAVSRNSIIFRVCDVAADWKVRAPDKSQAPRFYSFFTRFLLRAGESCANVGPAMKHMIIKSIGLTLMLAQLAGAATAPVVTPPAPAATTPPNPNAPKAQFAETSFNFGKVAPTDKPQHDFIVTNIGKTTLEITDVRPGCGCTTAGTWDRKIEPGQTGKIPLAFNPANFTGPISKGATVTCNDPEHASYYLQFQATVWRPIELQPQYVYFMPVEGEVTNDTKIVKIVNNLEEEVKLEAPKSASAAFTAELKTIRPGKEFELHVTYAGPVSNAPPQGNITVGTSSTNMPLLSVNAVAMPQPGLVALPQQINIPAGPLAPDYRYPAMIRNNSHTLVKLSEPSINIEGATVDLQEVEPGKNFRLNLGFPTNFQAKAGQPMELTVKTTNPKYPVMRVPINQMAAIKPAVPVPVVTPAASAPVAK